MSAKQQEPNIIPNLPAPKVQKVDLAALFTARQLPMSDQECVSDIFIIIALRMCK